MSFTSPRYSFLAAGGALVLATVGMPVSAAGGAAYVWPLMVTQPDGSQLLHRHQLSLGDV
jgi:hypothetical protein